MIDEKTLLVVLKSARQELDAVKEHLKEAQKRYDDAETAVINHLVEINADATAKYEGVGYAKRMKPRVYASCTKENEPELKAYLKRQGREDLIRETVAAQSLSGFVGELIDAGKPPPECISYYLKTSVRIY